MNSSAISVSGLRKAYRDKTVLNGIDLDVRAGTVLALLGPNGAGKTTTVNVLTSRENLLMMADLLHLPRAEGRRIADRLLDRFDLVDAANKRAASYSGGMHTTGLDPFEQSAASRTPGLRDRRG